MTESVSFLSYFFQASWMVRAIMLGLIGVSVASWAIIIYQARRTAQARASHNEFSQAFTAGFDLNNQYQRIKRAGDDTCGLERIYAAGFEAFLKVQDWTTCTIEQATTYIEDAMDLAAQAEVNSETRYLPFLASVSSVSPFVGLLGTVFGIMTTLHALGGSSQASLMVVAPGIAEALVATALGLFVAIPASIAYNRFTSTLTVSENDYTAFQTAFTQHLREQWYTKQA